MSNATTALGMLFRTDDGIGGPMTTVAEQRDVGVPEVSRNVLDVSTHNNTSGIEESLASQLMRLGEMTLKVNWLPGDATHNHSTGLLAAIKNRQKRNGQVVFPGSIATWSFGYYVTKFKPTGGVDTELGADITVKPVDYMTFA